MTNEVAAPVKRPKRSCTAEIKAAIDPIMKTTSRAARVVREPGTKRLRIVEFAADVLGRST
jgi:hypothetical protein